MEILIHKNDQQFGPFSREDVRQALSRGELDPADLAWTDGLPEWVPLAELIAEATAGQAPPPLPPHTPPAPGAPATIVDQARTGPLARLVGDDQDPAVVQKVVAKAQELLTRDEVIAYIGVQKKPLVNLSPDAVLLTNKRFMIVRPKLLGMTFQDHPWREVANVHMSEQILTATITCTLIGGAILAIDSIPKRQARRVYAFAQEIEELMHHQRRERSIEEKRAAAGGVVIHSPATTPQPPNPAHESPLQALTHLKAMLDAGLLDPHEFQAKKAEILARM